MVENLLIYEQNKLVVSLDEINAFQFIRNPNEKIKHPLAQKCLNNPCVQKWLGEHLFGSLINRVSFCSAVIQAYKIYLTECPKSCTATEIKNVRSNAKSLKYTLPEILPAAAESTSFKNGLNALITFNSSTLPTTASKKGNPRRRALIQDIAIKVYDALNVLPTSTVITSLVLVVTEISARSVRNIYTEKFRQEIQAAKNSRSMELNNNITTSVHKTTAIVDSMNRQLFHNQAKEKIVKRTDDDRVLDAITLLKEIHVNTT